MCRSVLLRAGICLHGNIYIYQSYSEQVSVSMVMCIRQSYSERVSVSMVMCIRQSCSERVSVQSILRFMQSDRTINQHNNRFKVLLIISGTLYVFGFYVPNVTL